MQNFFIKYLCLQFAPTIKHYQFQKLFKITPRTHAKIYLSSGNIWDFMKTLPLYY